VKWAKVAYKSSAHDVTHKKSPTSNQKIFFRVQTRRLVASFEPLNSSLPLSVPKLRARKATSDLVVLAQKSLKAAGCQSVKLLKIVRYSEFC